MILEAALAQTKFMLKKKSAVCVFFILFIMVIINFISNVIYFQGRDVLEMYHPMRLLLLSQNRVDFNASNTMLLIELYPILVVCVAGFSFAKEYQIDMNVFMVSRLGNLRYIISKYIAAFLVTSIVFTLPFLMEIILNCISFPLSAEGNLTNLSIYDDEYIANVNNYLMTNVYIKNVYIYTFLGTLLFGIVSGLLGVFTVAFSTVVKIKYNVILFLPVFMILNFTVIFSGKYLNQKPGISWYKYIFLFDDSVKNINFGIIGIILIIGFVLVTIGIKGRKDCL